MTPTPNPQPPTPNTQHPTPNAQPLILDSPTLQGLLHYVVRRLNEGSSQELLILKELLSRVGGCDYVEDINAEQLQGLAGGEFE